jgi:trimethylamine:corrinoid methyltransferase-like protein
MENFTQDQINQLQVQQASMAEIVKASGEAAIENRATLKALHDRLDKSDKILTEIGLKMMTEDKTIEIFRRQIDVSVSTLTKRVLFGVFTVLGGGIVTYLWEHIKWS